VSERSNVLVLPSREGLRDEGRTTREALPADSEPAVWSLGLRLPCSRHFIAVYVGQERRSLERLEAEGQPSVSIRRPRLTLMAGLLLAGFLFFSLLLGSVVSLYMLKSAAGIDLFEEHSPLHPFSGQLRT